MIKISLQNISRKIISFDVNPTTTFAEIEKMLSDIDSFKGTNYSFIYNGKKIDSSDTVESINYDPSLFITVAFHHISNKPKPPLEPNPNDQNFDEETAEKISIICALGYDRAEVVEALKKFDYDGEKAKNYVCYRLDNESNQKLVDLFTANPNGTIKAIKSYLEQTDPDLAKKVFKNLYPMLFMMGVVKKRNFEEEYDTFPYFY